MSGWRKIEVDGHPFRFRFGQGNVVIRDAQSKATTVDYATITGRSWNVLERGQWKKTGDGMVKPGHVRGWIRKRLLGTRPDEAARAKREAWSAPIDISGHTLGGTTLDLGEARIDPKLGPDRLVITRAPSATATTTVHHATGSTVLEPGQTASFVAIRSHEPLGAAIVEAFYAGEPCPQPGPAVFVPEESIR